MRTLEIAGVTLAPLVLYAIEATILFFVVRVILLRVRLYRWVWHRALFDAALFVCLLSLVTLCQ